jgi:hypothetical protein
MVIGFIATSIRCIRNIQESIQVISYVSPSSLVDLSLFAGTVLNVTVDLSRKISSPGPYPQICHVIATLIKFVDKQIDAMHVILRSVIWRPYPNRPIVSKAGVERVIGSVFVFSIGFTFRPVNASQNVRLAPSILRRKREPIVW